MILASVSPQSRSARQVSHASNDLEAERGDVEATVFADCGEAKRLGKLTSGTYEVNPAQPFSVYCDMNVFDGAGWAFLGRRRHGENSTEATIPLPEYDTAVVLPHAKWAYFREHPSLTLAFSNEGESLNGPGGTRTVYANVSQVDALRSANCQSLAADLTGDCVAKQENEGCDSKRLDYCNVGCGGRDRPTYTSSLCTSPGSFFKWCSATLTDCSDERAVTIFEKLSMFARFGA